MGEFSPNAKSRGRKDEPVRFQEMKQVRNKNQGGVVPFAFHLFLDWLAPRWQCARSDLLPYFDIDLAQKQRIRSDQEEESQFFTVRIWKINSKVQFLTRLVFGKHFPQWMRDSIEHGKFGLKRRKSDLTPLQISGTKQ